MNINSLSNAIKNKNGSALAEVYSKSHHTNSDDNLKRIVDRLFVNLEKIFPASRNTILKNQQDTDEMKRIWVSALAKNGVNTIEMIKSGIEKAQQQESSFWPSVGQFIAWCKSGKSDLPSVDDIYKCLLDYSSKQDLYEDASLYPWPHDVAYWVVLEARKHMIFSNDTAEQTRKRIKSELDAWAEKIINGAEIPKPVLAITQKPKPPKTAAEELGRSEELAEKGMELILKIRKARA